MKVKRATGRHPPPLDHRRAQRRDVGPRPARAGRRPTACGAFPRREFAADARAAPSRVLSLAVRRPAPLAAEATGVRWGGARGTATILHFFNDAVQF